MGKRAYTWSTFILIDMQSVYLLFCDKSLTSSLGLELERQERKDSETLAVEITRKAKRKWETAEKEKIAHLNRHIESQTIKITELCASNNEMSSRLERTQCELQTANAELEKLRAFQVSFNV